MQDENWIIEGELEESNPDELHGCKTFLDSKESEKNESGMTLSKQASMVGNSHFKDYRDYLGNKIESFNVREIL